MPGLLLDTHALYWLVSGERPLTDEALVEIALAQETAQLFVSPITAWELSVAAQKPRRAGRPELGPRSIDAWFRDAVRAASTKVIPIRQTIALEAARVVATTGHRDPGDCYLIATARVHRLALVTRDRLIIETAVDDPRYLTVIGC